jgi:hypothetical protein
MERLTCFRLLLACTSLSACTQTVEERLDELDARVTVDCGYVDKCAPQEDAEAVVRCMRDNRIAGIAAKATFILGLDPVAEVYTAEGGFVSVERYYEPAPVFTESRCRSLTVSGYVSTCMMARATDCEVVREWNGE